MERRNLCGGSSPFHGPIPITAQNVEDLSQGILDRQKDEEAEERIVRSKLALRDLFRDEFEATDLKALARLVDRGEVAEVKTGSGTVYALTGREGTGYRHACGASGQMERTFQDYPQGHPLRVGKEFQAGEVSPSEPSERTKAHGLGIEHGPAAAPKFLPIYAEQARWYIGQSREATDPERARHYLECALEALDDHAGYVRGCVDREPSIVRSVNEAGERRAA